MSVCDMSMSLRVDMAPSMITYAEVIISKTQRIEKREQGHIHALPIKINQSVRRDVRPEGE
jgi:hypothetical protein